LVGNSETSNEFVDPLDASYVAGSYDTNAMNGPTMVEEYNFGQFVGPFTSFPGNAPQMHPETNSVSH
jgi:hypothetical protein